MTYAPNDSNITTEALDFLHSSAGQPLLAQLADNPSPTIAQIQKLRKSFPKDAVHAALTLAELQPKAKQKFPNLPGFIYAIPEALEQSTDSTVAAHKAARFAQAKPSGGGHILDLCSGIGGDALALANIAPTTAMDLSAPRLTCLRYNAQSAPPKHALDIRQTDVASILNSEFTTLNSFFHIDPARRTGEKRSPKYQDLIPGPDFLEKLIAQFPGGAIKLSSAVDFDSLPGARGGGHLEIISHNQSVVQAILWLGTLASPFPPNTRTATIFRNHQLLFTYTAVPAIPQSHGLPPLDSFTLHSSLFTLYEADPALTRSQLAAPLAHSLNLTPLTIDAGYLLGQGRGGRQIPTHPALTAFQIHQITPYSESKLLKILQESPLFDPKTTQIEVKTRGKLPGIDTDHLQKRLTAALKTKTANSANIPAIRTVFIFKPLGQITQIHAAIATRITQTP